MINKVRNLLGFIAAVKELALIWFHIRFINRKRLDYEIYLNAYTRAGIKLFRYGDRLGINLASTKRIFNERLAMYGIRESA